ncbi:uncharacterized protein [Diadema antillarum]|uniref:uncharacterized protein n=1 Tax=Diadema antillarum TaxID=105358 RepID=UPI003A8C4EA6
MENPIFFVDKTFDEYSSPSTAVDCGNHQEQVSFEYKRFDIKAHSRCLKDVLKKYRWAVPNCAVIAVLIACGTLLGLIVVSVKLSHTNSILATSRDLIQAQDRMILNQTQAIEQFRMELNNDQGPDARSQSTSSENNYIRWGVTECPKTSSLIYSGVAASGSSSSQKPGGGSNYLCMTSDPEYRVVVAGQQYERGKVYGAEYRNGLNFAHQTSLHTHDVPCASCLTKGRQNILMVPGTASCPTNWTKEYNGFLMAARQDQMRTSYICVDHDAVDRPGTAAVAGGHAALLFPVEGVCLTGGGLPCRPYVDGNELQCVVCSH